LSGFPLREVVERREEEKGDRGRKRKDSSGGKNPLHPSIPFILKEIWGPVLLLSTPFFTLRQCDGHHWNSSFPP